LSQNSIPSKLKEQPSWVALSFAWRRPTLTGGILQLPSALRSLTSVFDMGTGVTFSPSPPDCIHKETYFAFAKNFIPSKLDNVEEEEVIISLFVWKNPNLLVKSSND
jgi:hypothetical protein